MSINEHQEEIIENFELFENTADKYDYIIELGKKLPPLDQVSKTEEHIIKGCQSKVWMTANCQDGQIVFRADSDAMIVKGIVSLLVKVLSKQSPQAIIDADLFFIERIGLSQMLSMNRSNGLAAMLKQMKHYAVAFSQN